MAGIYDAVKVQKPSEVLQKVEQSVPDSHEPIADPVKKEASGISAALQGIMHKNPILVLAVIILVAGGIFTYFSLRGGGKRKTKRVAKSGVKRVSGI